MYYVALADLLALCVLCFAVFRLCRAVRDAGGFPSIRGYGRSGSGDCDGFHDCDNPDNSDNSGSCPGYDYRSAVRFINDHGRR